MARTSISSNWITLHQISCMHSLNCLCWSPPFKNYQIAHKMLILTDYSKHFFCCDILSSFRLATFSIGITSALDSHSCFYYSGSSDWTFMNYWRSLKKVLCLLRTGCNESEVSACVVALLPFWLCIRFRLFGGPGRWQNYFVSICWFHLGVHLLNFKQAWSTIKSL